MSLVVEDPALEGGDAQEVSEWLVSRNIPMQPQQTPDDVGNAVIFLWVAMFLLKGFAFAFFERHITERIGNSAIEDFTSSFYVGWALPHRSYYLLGEFVDP